MRFLLDENLPKSLVRELRNFGHDVIWVKETLRGEGDDALLAVAQTDGRVFITLDKDFGDLTFRDRLPALGGIILFRLNVTAPDVMIAHMIRVILSRDEWPDIFRGRRKTGSECGHSVNFAPTAPPSPRISPFGKRPASHVTSQTRKPVCRSIRCKGRTVSGRERRKRVFVSVLSTRTASAGRVKRLPRIIFLRLE